MYERKKPQTCLLTIIGVIAVIGVVMVQRERACPIAAVPRTPHIYSAKQRKLRQACQNLVVPYDPSCPRMLSYRFTIGAGFGHQLMELMFGMRKARIYGLSYVFDSFVISNLHKDNYTAMNQLLGLHHIFSDVIGMNWSQIQQTVTDSNTSWQKLNTSIPPQLSNIGCDSFMISGGYLNCPSGPKNNCFYAPENSYLFEDASECLRTASREFGLAGSHCIFTDVKDKSDRHTLPNDTVHVVWHIRSGDITLHSANDMFYESVINELKQVTVGYKLRVFLVGKGVLDSNGASSVSSEYVEMIRILAVRIWNETVPQYVPDVIAPTYSFKDAFLAMMQADLLIGSGSSLPAVASLVSGIPLFFNHVPKHGYNHGAEMTAGSVDMESNGTVLESRRRLRVEVYRRVNAIRRTACR